MGIDDKIADMATIEKMRTRLELLSKVKEDLLAANKELQEQIKQLKMELTTRDYERDCLLLEINYLRSKEDK